MHVYMCYVPFINILRSGIICYGRLVHSFILGCPNYMYMYMYVYIYVLYMYVHVHCIMACTYVYELIMAGWLAIGNIYNTLSQD